MLQAFVGIPVVKLNPLLSCRDPGHERTIEHQIRLKRVGDSNWWNCTGKPRFPWHCAANVDVVTISKAERLSRWQRAGVTQSTVEWHLLEDDVLKGFHSICIRYPVESNWNPFSVNESLAQWSNGCFSRTCAWASGRWPWRCLWASDGPGIVRLSWET